MVGDKFCIVQSKRIGLLRQLQYLSGPSQHIKMQGTLDDSAGVVLRVSSFATFQLLRPIHLGAMRCLGPPTAAGALCGCGPP